MSTQPPQSTGIASTDSLLRALCNIITLHGNGQFSGSSTYLPDGAATQADQYMDEEPSSRATQRDVLENVASPWRHIARKQVLPTGYGLALAKEFGALPHKDQVEVIVENAESFVGVPETPPATRDALDKQLQGIQSKLETIMNLQVQQFMGEDKDFRDTGTLISCMTLQCFHEVQEMRRRNFVKGNTNVLQRSNSGARLLSEEEEGRLRQSRSRSPAGRGSGFGRGRGQSPFRPFRGRGRGRGFQGNGGRSYQGGWRSRSNSPRRSFSNDRGRSDSREH
jgi:hypothetical protein